MTNFLLSCIIQFVASVNTLQAKLIGLSPNGKATDSDSVIFKVRILVAQLEKAAGLCEFKVLRFFTYSEKRDMEWEKREA